MTSSPCSTASCILMARIDVITFILGIAGNGTVIWITLFKMKKSVSAIWYLSLAVTDFLFCSIIPFNFAHTIEQEWAFGRFLCKFVTFFTSLKLFSSAFLLVIISVDCCVVEKFPAWAQNKRSTTKATVVVLVVWIFSAALSVPNIIGPVTVSYDNQISCLLHDQSKHFITALLFGFTVGFLIPFLIVSVCYLAITGKVIEQKSKKQFQVLIMLICSFVVCWTPYHIVALVKIHSGGDKNIPLIAWVLAIALVKANSFLNPFLYAFMGKDFKMEFYLSLSNIQRETED